MAVEYPHPDSMHPTLRDETKKYEQPYSPEYAEELSISSIAKAIEKGYANREQAEDHHGYIRKLKAKYAAIVAAERSSGMINEALNAKLLELTRMESRLKEIIDKF